MLYLKMCLFVLVVIFTLSSCTVGTGKTEGRDDSNDFLIEYDDNGLAILKKYLGIGGDVVIPDGVNVIGEHVFDLISYKDDRIITKVYIPDSVTVISDYAFSCCYRLDEGIREVRMSSNIEHIGKSAFDNCIYLEKVVFDSSPGQVICIDDKAFAYCSALTGIEISETALFGEDVFIGTELEAVYSGKYNTYEKIDGASTQTDVVLSPEDMVIEPMVTPDENDPNAFDDIYG